MPPNIDPFAAFFGVNAQIHIEDASITQINGTLDERVDVDERILENTGNVHNIRFREKALEYTTSDRRENRGSRGRNSSTEPPETSASENSESGADESEGEAEGPPRVPSEAVTRAPYQQPTLPFAPPRKYQSEQSNREANYLALVNASAAMDMQAQREQRASNRGALLPSALMSLGTPGLIPNMMPGMPGIGGPVGIPGNAYAQMPYHPGMNTRSTNISTSYAVQNPNGTTTTTTTSISGSGMGLPVVGRGLLEVQGVPTLKGHVVETKRIETTEAKRSGNVLNATYTTTKKTTQKYAHD